MGSRLGRMGRKLGEWIPPGVAQILAEGFGRPAAVFFHGVEPVTLDSDVQVNHHEAPVFRAIMAELQRNFDVLPVTLLDEALCHPEHHRRTVFLMSDDGYANTLSTAAPILEELELPWTLFVSTHHIDTRDRNPVFLARLFFCCMPAGRYEVPHLPALELEGPETREAMTQAGTACLHGLDMDRANEAVAAMVKALEQAGLASLIERFSSESFLTWPQVRELKRRGVEIGAHAHWHWPLNAAQTAAQLREQARRPRQRIEAEIGPCRYFAYPFGNTGDVSRAGWQAVRDAGYEAAFTTVTGTPEVEQNRFLLPRYGIGPDETHLASLIPLLSAGNRRLMRWQKELAA
ncbi:MAG: polysaccharide deacetylase family protein [Alphaproteobacteria bacterium]|nr:polysaccharide deacetylase family protein [Alphaproteobacteria bacterium]